MTVTRRAVLGSAAVAAMGTWSARAQTVTARIGVIPILATAPVIVAEREGWLRAAGITTTFTTFESGPNMIQALASGTLDVYVAGVAPLGVARARGVDVKVVAATAVEENVFVAGPRLAQSFAATASPAEAFKHWRAASGSPARLATQPLGSVPNTTLQHWLWEVAKVDRSDVTIVSMGIDATQQAVLVGAVEGGILREPALTIVTDRNPAIKLIARGGELFPNQPGTVVAVTNAFLTAQPRAAQALVEAVHRAVALINENPARVAPHLEAALGKGIVSAETLTRALRSPASRFVADPRGIVQPTAAMQTYQVKLGAMEREVPLDGLFEPRLFERAVATR